MLIIILALIFFCPANAQTNPKFKNFTVVDTFSEGLAFAAMLEYYAGMPNTDKFYNTVGYIDTAGKWIVKPPLKLTNLYMGYYFKGEPFYNGKALMRIAENGFDCNCSAVKEGDKKNKIRLASNQVVDPKYVLIKIP